MGAETDRRLSTTDVGRAPLSLLACALAAGLLLGLLAPVTSQDGLDGSLVLAGIVHYPPQSPMNQYFLDSWTIIYQLGALLLRADLDQAYVSEIFFLVPCALLVGAYAAVMAMRLLLQRPVSAEPISLYGGAALFSGQPAGEIFASLPITLL